PVGDGLLFAPDHAAGSLQRMSTVLDVALRAEVLHPGDPFLDRFLRLLRGCRGISAAEEVSEFAHRVPLECEVLTVRRLEGPAADREPSGILPDQCHATLSSASGSISGAVTRACLRRHFSGFDSSRTPWVRRNSSAATIRTTCPNPSRIVTGAVGSSS